MTGACFMFIIMSDFAKKREAGDFCTIPQEGLCILEENRSRS